MNIWTHLWLVKHRLATVRTESVGEPTYVYHLHSNWAAMADLLSALKEPLNPIVISWLEEMRSNEDGQIHH